VTRAPVVGAEVGSIAGAVDGEGPGFWMLLVGCVIFAGGIGALVGGYGSLLSPSPGSEPADTRRPVRDRPELRRDEADR
jgi:hypothetical protein